MKIRKRVFLAIILTTIIAGVFIRSPLSVLPAIYILLAIIISFFYLLIIKNSCEIIVERSRQKEYIRMSNEKYTIKVRNKSILIFPMVRFTMELQDKKGRVFKEYSNKFILNPREENTIYIDMEFPHIGNYIVKILKLEIFGIFNIYSMDYDPKWEEDILVVAKKHRIGDYELDTNRAIFQVEFPTAYKIEGEIYDDIREYVPGDPIKNIHWKLSAHANQYMTRILRNDAVSGVSVYLDFCGSSELSYLEMAQINDSIVEIGYAIGLYTLKNNRGISYIYSQNNSQTISSPKDEMGLKNIIYSLPCLASEEKLRLEILLLEYANSPKSLDNIFIVSNNLNLDLVGTSLSLKERGKKISLIVINYKLNDCEINVLKDSGIDYLIVKTAKEFVGLVGGGTDE